MKTYHMAKRCGSVSLSVFHGPDSCLSNAVLVVLGALAEWLLWLC